MPTISVVIPCYNGARYIGETLESVLAQNLPDIEIIVVDDGSTDGSMAIVAGYPQVRPIVQRSAGVAAARNTGLRHATGDYLVFLDHDDRLLPHALETNLLCLLDHPECAFAFGDIQHINTDGVLLPSRSAYGGGDYYLRLLHGSYIWTPGAAMYRRAVLEQLSGFDSRVDCVSHYDLNLRITRLYPACYSKKLVLEYRLHDTNTSRDHALMLRSEITVLRSQKRWVHRDPQYMRALRSGVRFYEDRYGRPLLAETVANIRRRRQWRETWTAMLTILRYAPLLPVRCAYLNMLAALRTPSRTSCAALAEDPSSTGKRSSPS
ncbi:MAG TPA: glycosyltransferase [Chloroflexota bacterium]|nr:glycosyltransferase [Chloroflexota bacterium]